MAEEKLQMTPYDLNDYFIENYYFIEEYCCCKQAQFCSNVGEVAAPIHLKGSSPNFASNIKRIRAINQAMFRLISKNKLESLTKNQFVRVFKNFDCNIGSKSFINIFEANIQFPYPFFKVNNRDTKTRCKICLKLTIKTLERRQWRRSSVFIVNFEHISHLVLVILLLALNK